MEQEASSVDNHAVFLRALDAAIPHMDPRYRHVLHISVKMSELVRLRSFYNSDAASVKAKEAQKPTWRQDMLRAIRPCFTEERQKKLDVITALVETNVTMNEILQNKGDIII